MQVYILPTIRINDGQYRGRLAYSDVLRAICSGFMKGQEPSACMHVTSDACSAGSPADVACKAKCALSYTASQIILSSIVL